MKLTLHVAAFACGTLLFAGHAGAAGLTLGKPIDACAPRDQTKRVQSHLAANPAALLHEVSDALALPEVRVATGLGANAVAVRAEEALLKKIWRSVDAWGKSTAVRLVFTPGGGHVIDIASNVPITQKDLDDGWIDMYADDGAGVHGHLWLGTVRSVHAVELPGTDGTRTRVLSFYGADGRLIFGVYASRAGEPHDESAAVGFERTRELIAALPQLCS